MNVTPILTMILLFALLFAVAVLTYLYIRDKTLEDIREDVYKLFLEAEHHFEYTAAGKQKMSFVISRARLLLPTWAQFFVTEELLKKVVQLWFDAVKELLDDGKYNNSQKK